MELKWTQIKNYANIRTLFWAPPPAVVADMSLKFTYRIILWVHPASGYCHIYPEEPPSVFPASKRLILTGGAKAVAFIVAFYNGGGNLWL